MIENKKENKDNIIIVVLSIILVLMLGVVIFFTLINNNKCKYISKKEYYTKMEQQMFSFYTVFIKNVKQKNLQIENKEDGVTTARIDLIALEKYGFDLSDFKKYNSEVLCDVNESYALISKSDNKTNIAIYYSCGGDKNYE